MKGLLLSIAFIILICNCRAGETVPQSPYIIISDTSGHFTLSGSGWQMMADREGTLSLNQVLHSSHFQDTVKKVDYRFQVYWMRCRLKNKMSEDAKIALPVAAAYVDLYIKKGNGKWQHFKTGTLVRWSRRDGLKRIPAFTLTIPAGATLTVYKRVRWDYVATQPDSMSVSLVPTQKLIRQNYIQDESGFMTSMQDAFVLGLFVLSMIISFYFFLVVREKEFLYFSLYLLIASLYSIPTLHDVFLREHPYFLLYLYIISNSIMAFGLIHSLRQFLKTFRWFPRWDKILVVFSFLLVAGLLSSYFVSSVFHTDLSAPAHLVYNLFMVVSAVMVLITLFLYIRHHSQVTRLMIIAFTPILCLKLIAYLVAVIYGLYYPRLGEPAASGDAPSFNKAGFFIMIVTYLWMIGLFNWGMFRRFSNIRKGFLRQQELDRLKSRFFANISHEFRTPLTLIMGPVEDLLTGGDTDQFKDLLPEVHRNSKRLLQLINQLLDLSRLDSNSYQINTNREDIIPFVRQIVHSFLSLATRENIDLELEVDPLLKEELFHGNIQFYFDEDIIEKILNNLLSNAFKFTRSDGGGAIMVSIGLSEKKKGFLELKVKDTGIGIRIEKLTHIFDRFYQTDDFGKKKYEGSGIGLALIKELVDLLHGDIFVQSEPGKGTIFYCYLPLNKKIISEKQLAGNKQIKSAVPEFILNDEDIETGHEIMDKEKCHVLIVEDHKDVRKYIRKKLESSYMITEAKDGRKGFEIALKQIPDLVISDVMMPEMDGFELCKRLKTDDLTSHIPVILLTARAENNDKMTGLETCADVYLIKPFNSRELRIQVKNLIEIRNKMRTKFSGNLIVKPSEITVTSVDQQFMQRLLDVVEGHISDQQFSVDQLAEEMNMSASQMYRKLKALIDQSAQQFIRSIRMQRALELLKNNSGTVSEISWKVGFEDPGYFSKVFKKHFGCLPSEKEKFPN